MISPLNAIAESLSQEQKLEFFEAKIRPVLVTQCYECHNSHGEAQGGLALDFRGALLSGGDSGESLIPGNADESLILQVIRHELDGMEMPMNSPPLDPSVIADFKKWIEDGAVDPRDAAPTSEELAQQTSWEVLRESRKRHWSLQPIQTYSIPAVADSDWSHQPIDRFLLSKMETQNLAPVHDASPETLLRRAFYALTGLPPTAAECEEWLPRLSIAQFEDRQVAFAALVDELLSRPQFGEHWARHWLDWLRYAESHGSEGDPQIANAWQYRDYLIRAFNADVPYHQLVRESIAGDLLKNPRINHELKINESMIGPAHWRMVFHGFTPTDALDEKVRFVDDEINVVTKAFLGLTVSCARCHNHKFDAISQADYFALYGIIGSCRLGQNIIDETDVQIKNVEELTGLKSQIRAELSKLWLSQIEERADWSFASNDRPGELTKTLNLLTSKAETHEEQQSKWLQLRTSVESELQSLADFRSSDHFRNWNFREANAFQQWYRFGFGAENSHTQSGDFIVALDGDQAIAQIVGAGIHTHKLSSKHAAAISSPEFKIDGEYAVWLRVSGDGGAVGRYVIQDYPRNGLIFPIMNPSPEWRWVKLDMSYWKGDSGYIELTSARDAAVPLSLQDRSWFGLTDVVITQNDVSPPKESRRSGVNYLIMNLDQRMLSPSGEIDQVIKNVVRDSVIAWQAGTPTEAQADLLDACLEEGLLANQLSEIGATTELIQNYRRLESEISVPQRVPGLLETVSEDHPLFVRGDHKQPGEIVPRRFLEFIDERPYSTTLSGRSELAEDILRSDNPLTRRVVVNRVWHHLFGEGLFRTPDNVGKMGDQPVHSELLDWLSIRFSDQGWSFKTMIREVMLSRVWQLDSTPTLESTELDPDNRYLSHAMLQRLPAEAIRDTILSVSNRLDLGMSGPSTNGDSDRRSVYVSVTRNQLDPFLREFDFPEPFATTGRRDVTNVPAQSLTLMNDANVSKSASAWAQHLLESSQQESDPARIESLFVKAFSRKPTQQEVQSVQEFLSEIQDEQSAISKKRTRIEEQILEKNQQLQALLENSVGVDSNGLNIKFNPNIPEPLSCWEFEETLTDEQGRHHLTVVGGDAIFEDGAFVLNGQNYLTTEMLPLNSKATTLEVWVQLATLNQSGGGVMSLQANRGDLFNSIVFGEMRPKEWLIGSEYFNRTKDLQGPIETTADQEPVQLCATFAEDGMVSLYRDGLPYGDSYQVNSDTLRSGQAFITFGVRHLPAGAGRMLQGKILKAQFYDHALSPAEVLMTYESASPLLLSAKVAESLSESDRDQFNSLKSNLQDLKAELAMLPQTGISDDLAIWTELIRGIFLMKEFIYIR